MQPTREPLTRVDQAHAWVLSSRGPRRAGLAFVTGAMSVLAFAPVFAFPVLFLTLPVFVWLIDASVDWRAAAKAGWWFGLGYFFFNLFWIGEAFLVEADKFAWLLPVAITLLPAGLALFWALAAGAARAIWPAGLARVFVFAIVLTLVEWLRGHLLTGLPWNVLGYALTYPLALMQSAAVFGAYGLTALATLIFSAPLVMMADRQSPNRAGTVIIAAGTALLPLAGLWTYGSLRLSEPQSTVPGVMLRIVQPSVPQREKWMPEFQRRIFEDHLALTATNAQGARDDLAGITHVIWPEAAMPFLPLEHPEALQAIAAVLPDGRQLITGALHREAVSGDDASQLRMFNGMMVFNDAGALTATYDKIHLVPFGEYLPFEPLLSALGLQKLTHGRGSFVPGPSPRQTMTIAGLPPVLGLICYEALFPGSIVETPTRPSVLINVTNDGWFGNSSGPRQHFHQTRVRAVEEGIPVIRAANNGISAVVDRYGRVLQELGMNVRGVIDSPLPGGAAPTTYARHGDLALWALLAAYAVAAIWASQKSRR